jgi:hypothetical protein
MNNKIQVKSGSTLSYLDIGQAAKKSSRTLGTTVVTAIDYLILFRYIQWQGIKLSRY